MTRYRAKFYVDGSLDDEETFDTMAEAETWGEESVNGFLTGGEILEDMGEEFNDTSDVDYEIEEID